MLKCRFLCLISINSFTLGLGWGLRNLYFNEGPWLAWSPEPTLRNYFSKELTQHPLHHLGFMLGKPPCSPFQTKIELWFSSSGNSWFIWVLTGHCLFSSLPVSSISPTSYQQPAASVDPWRSLSSAHSQASPVPGGCVSCISRGDWTMAPQPCGCLIIILGCPRGPSF